MTTPKEVEVTLLSGILDRNGKLTTRVVLRAPSYAEFMALGEPQQLVELETGGRTLITNTDVIEGYLAACVVEPAYDSIYNSNDFRNARVLRDALLGFFTQASAVTSTGSPTPSSSDFNGIPDSSSG